MTTRRAVVQKGVSEGAQPFTVPHFRAWSKTLELDTGESWELEPFQARILADLFSGFRETWLVIPEGNAKTTLAAAIALYHAQFHPDGMVTIAASSRDQANWLFLAAAGFVSRSDSIRGRFRVQEGTRRIRCDSVGSRIQIYAADDRTGDGARPTLAILEELHRHRDLRLYRTWSGKLDKVGGQLLAISTAGEPEGEFELVRKKIRDEATKSTRRGAFLRATSETTVLHEYSVPDGKDPFKISEAVKANPLKSITPETLRRKQVSRGMIPSHWLRFVCGRAAGLEEENIPITAEQWDPLAVEVGGVADGEPVWLAVRVGQAGGCSIGIAAVREEAVAIRCEVYPYSFPGLERALKHLLQRYDVQMIYIDIRQQGLGSDILEAGGLPLENLPQSPVRLMEATATFLGLMSASNLIHDGDEVLRKQALSSRMKETVTGAYFEPSSETQGLIAVILAVHEAMKHAKEKPPRIHVYRGA